MGRKQRGIQKFAGKIIRLETGIDEITGNGRNQKRQDTQGDHGAPAVPDKLEISLHPRQRHQEKESERTKRVDQRQRMRLHHIRLGPEKRKQRRKPAEKIESVRSDQHSHKEQSNHIGDLEFPEKKRNNRHQSDQDQK